MKHNVLIKNVTPDCYAAAVLLRKVYKQIERSAWEKAREAFLDEELKKHGTLTCHYCHRKELKRKGGPMKDRATVDHVRDTSNGGDLIDKRNFVVSCDACNRKKSNTLVENFEASKYLANKRKTKS